MFKISPIHKMWLETYFLAGVVLFLVAGYLQLIDSFSILTKTFANTAVIMMALSMWLSSLSYFWDFADARLKYRKYLGLIGFWIGIGHALVSRTALFSLFSWQGSWDSTFWSFAAGATAFVIFSAMAMISSTWALKKMGGKAWRRALRTGYVALLLVWAHVVLLKWPVWAAWWADGSKTLPELSLLISVFIVVVVMMRLVMAVKMAFFDQKK